MALHVVDRAFRLSPGQLFDLVLDVESYPRFVPWWEAARVIRREPPPAPDRPGAYETEQVVSLKVVRQRFVSRTTYLRPDWIEVRAADGLFRAFLLRWAFRPVGDGDCEVDLAVDFQFRSRHLARFASVLSGEAVRMLMHAFEHEAERRYHAAGGVDAGPGSASAIHPMPAGVR